MPRQPIMPKGREYVISNVPKKLHSELRNCGSLRRQGKRHARNEARASFTALVKIVSPALTSCWDCRSNGMTTSPTCDVHLMHRYTHVRNECRGH